MNEKITLRTTRTRDLNNKERAAIVALCNVAHQSDFNSLFVSLPPDGLHVMAFDADRVVSHAVVTTRRLQPNNLPFLKTAYVDAVSTEPAYQGQGIGSAVMQHLELQISEYEMGCLETDRFSFYGRLGWQRWRGSLAGIQDGKLIPTPIQTGVMVLALASTPSVDVEGSLTIAYDGRMW